MTNELDEELSRFREALQAHAAKGDQRSAASKDGLVQVTVDQQMRVVAVEFADKSMPEERRVALQNATAEAMNAAMQEMVLSSAEALLGIQTKMGW